MGWGGDKPGFGTLGKGKIKNAVKEFTGGDWRGEAKVAQAAGPGCGEGDDSPQRSGPQEEPHGRPLNQSCVLGTFARLGLVCPGTRSA